MLQYVTSIPAGILAMVVMHRGRLNLVRGHALQLFHCGLICFYAACLFLSMSIQ